MTEHKLRFKDLFESDRLALVRMMTQSVRGFELDIAEIANVQHRRVSGSRPKECFNNSFKAMSGTTDKFVLGYAFLHGVPIEHAWIKDGEQYFDVTLDPKKMEGYVKVVEISFEEVMGFVDEHGFAPSIYDLNRWLASKKNL